MKKYWIAMMIAIVALSIASPVGATKPEILKLNVCHATASQTNPYVLINVNVHSVETAQNVGGHGGHGGDIWAPYTYGGVNYPGQGDQSILANDCEVNGDGGDGGDGEDGGNGGRQNGNGGVSPLGCWMNFQLYARAADGHIDVAYVAAAWTAENPDAVSVGEGEVISLYDVKNGVAASPPGQIFVAIATGGLGDVDGYGTTYKCSGYMMANLYDATGIFVGHARYADSNTFGKGFHAINSGESLPLDFLDMGFSLN